MINIKHTGLTDEQVSESREKHGDNVLSPPEKVSAWKLFAEKFNDPIIRILMIAAFLSLGISIMHNEYSEIIGILCAIFLATGLSFWFEMDANKKFEILNKLSDEDSIKVYRNGNICTIGKKEVVVDDIVIVETGDEIPADGVLLESISLNLNESSLTGEPSVHKTVKKHHFDDEATYQSDHVMRGSTVLEGHGIFTVLRVGDDTEIGRVAQKSTEQNTEDTPLNKQLHRLAKFIEVVGFTLAFLTFVSLFVKDIIINRSSYNLAQLSLLLIAFVAFFVAAARIWMPTAHSALELMGLKKGKSKVKERSWIFWISIGLTLFVTLALALYLVFNISVLDKSSWISLSVAEKILNYFMIAVTLIVVAVPEGLPMSVTISLALNMRRMLKTNNLVRKMHASETMGAVSVICTDKTGTLTQNKMQVSYSNFLSLNKNQDLDTSEASTLIKENISLNSTAFLEFDKDKKVSPLGNPTEGALLLWLHKNKIDYNNFRETTDVTDQLTFSTERKFMATLVSSPILKKNILYIKGAPEIVLGKCKNALCENNTKKNVDEIKDDIDYLLLGYQQKAMRTLGFAYKIIDGKSNCNDSLEENDLTFLGITAISDPIRPDVPSAVKSCLDAGIEVKIVTGDTPGTAKEIGRQIGIWSSNNTDRNIISGIEFESLSDAEAQNKARQIKIMCRARPTDKQRLVRMLQRNKEIVAVTGDGTNDAPALNFANVGLSMGSGTPVAKGASDITLMDDSFGSIATAVMWGRSLYANIQKFLLFQLTINLTALIVVLVGSIFGQEPPLKVTQMLWVNLIMDTFAAMALASLPPDPELMKNKPRNNNDFIITPLMSKNIIYIGLSFVVILLFLFIYLTLNDGTLSEYDLSYFFTFFVMLQFWNMFNAKAFGSKKSGLAQMKENRTFVFVALLILVGQFFIVTFGGEVFSTVPLKWQDWTEIILFTSLILWIGEGVRFYRRIKK